MRKFIEPTARNLLRRPLVLGVPMPGLVTVAGIALTLFVLVGTSMAGSIASLALGFAGYLGLRIASRFARTGWEESWLFTLERRLRKPSCDGRIERVGLPWTVSNPDTLTEADLLMHKEILEGRLLALRPDERLTVALLAGEKGATLKRISCTGHFDLRQTEEARYEAMQAVGGYGHAYSLYQLPVTTDPLWLFSLFKRLEGPYSCVVSFKGVDPATIKSRIEIARRSNSADESALSNIDAEVSFEEASQVLRSLSRGEDAVFEVSLVIFGRVGLDLDERMFIKEAESDFELALFSVTGVRQRFHRSHWVRLPTAMDMVPNIGDPNEGDRSMLNTTRGTPLTFSPQDGRLESLHWVVAGASGSGKSFFTGLLLKRMLEAGTPMSVLFIDHNRSFRRFVRGMGAPFVEPQSIAQLELESRRLFSRWERQGSVSGIELSDLSLADQKDAAAGLLSRIEAFLRHRTSTHPFYVVLDECWNLMRDNPVMVQRAFREYRKLNGAVIAITQSLEDFVTDESGQSIFQNAPIRVLLRQGEDIVRYQGILGLNSTETAKVSRLKQIKGEFSECLIKTPFLSRLGRLHPTPEEYELFRTDNLREERVAEARLQSAEAPCVQI